MAHGKSGAYGMPQATWLLLHASGHQAPMACLRPGSTLAPIACVRPRGCRRSLRLPTLLPHPYSPPYSMPHQQSTCLINRAQPSMPQLPHRA
jgi:hypothetical protein